MKVFLFNRGKNASNYINVLNSLKVNYTLSFNPSKAVEHTHLILCGGGDVHPVFYSQSIKSCSNVNLYRDLSEFWLINYFRARNLPILGICRGMQVINVALGGTLSQSIPDYSAHYRNNSDLFHVVENLDFMKTLYGKTCVVNSAHKQRVLTLGKTLKACSFTDDFTCEAFSSVSEKILGVQFHPERPPTKKTVIFDYFLSL